MLPKPVSPARRAAAVAFRKYAPALHRFLVRRLKQRSEAADLMQEVFERYLRVKEADSVRNPQAYLFGIATHVVGDARLREEASLVLYDSEQVDEIGNGPELAVAGDLADKVGLTDELQRALQRLPPVHRAALLLTVCEGYSHREAAERLRLTEKTVSFYVHEGKARLRSILRKGYP